MFAAKAGKEVLMNDVLCEGALNEVMNKLTRGDRECVPLKSVVQVLSRKHGAMDINRKNSRLFR